VNPPRQAQKEGKKEGFGRYIQPKGPVRSRGVKARSVIRHAGMKCSEGWRWRVWDHSEHVKTSMGVPGVVFRFTHGVHVQ